MVGKIRHIVGWVSAVGMIVAAGLQLSRWLLRVPVPHELVFLGVALGVALPTGLWWSWADGVLTRVGRAKLRLLAGGFSLVMLSPLAWLFTGAREVWDAYPLVLIMWIMLWHMAVVIVGYVAVAAGTGGRLWTVIGGMLKRGATGDAEPVDARCAESPGLTRRSVLVMAGSALPLVLAGTGIAGGLKQAGRFRVRRIQIAAPRLPHRLRGLTITHISDIHVGRLYTPDHLPRLVEAVNDLRSDIVAITGDMVDHSIQFLPPALEAIGQMEHRYGRFSVVGNHDLIDSPQRFLTEYGLSEPGLLCDVSRPVLIDGERMQVAGLLWSFQAYATGRDPGHAARADAALLGRDPGCFTLGLVHHPHAFDALADRGVDVVLAGHTHGGQLMLTPPGAERPIGGGSLWFKYLWGVYQRDASLLHVTSGVGNWFPVRINAPAEIVQIQLV